MLEDGRMAKSTNKVTDTKKAETKTAAVEKASETTAKKVEKAVEEPKKLTTAKEPAKIATAKEPKKITTAKEPKKIAAKKEPEKIAAKPQPKKIETKKVEQLPLKEETPVAVEEVKAAPKKKTVKKAVKKTEEKPVEKKPVEKKAVKEKKPAAKKPVKQGQGDLYLTWSLEECIGKMQAMGVNYQYEDYKRVLFDEADTKVLEKNILEGNDIASKGFTFEKDGFDEALVLVTLQKVMDTMDLKAADFKTMKKDATACLKTTVTEDAEKNASEYLKEFKLCEKILMIGQRKNISDSSEVSELLGFDVNAIVEHFFKLAYDVLPTWQYSDVKYYEDFAFAILSQYQDLYEAHQLHLLIDVADLYIKHGDFTHGDVCYGYILRDNQIKDYIYYRFAHVYESIDMNKAKKLAYEALQYVDARFMYYTNIMEIINK